jgi:3-deoxy-manno-octulosonate cytidylyltransferase (CMP-KDO synthetase)
LRAHKQNAAFSGTTCIRGADGRALWFSKTIIPAIRDEAGLRAVRPIVAGLAAPGPLRLPHGSPGVVRRHSPEPYEKLEGLEQLRFLEGGRTIATIEVDPPTHAVSGIDTAADLALAEEAIARLGDPFPA